MPTAIEKDIYRAIAYFSFFGYPLTAFEIWKWQYDPLHHHSFSQIMEMLRSSKWLGTLIESKNGFYGLHSKKYGHIERQLKMRHKRFLNAVIKYRKLKKVLSYLTRLPFIKGIALCNSLVFHHTREKSDIDLFLVTKKGRIWTSRFLSVVPLMLLRQRPGETRQNPIDVSFFITPEAYSFTSMKIDDEDPYLATWIRSLVPVYGREDIFQVFVRHNAWAKTLLPNSQLPKRPFSHRHEKKIKFPSLTLPESWLAFLQRKKFPKDIQSSINEDSRVVVSEDVLKFHKNDRREEILNALNKKLEAVGIKYEKVS